MANVSIRSVAVACSKVCGHNPPSINPTAKPTATAKPAAKQVIRRIFRILYIPDPPEIRLGAAYWFFPKTTRPFAAWYPELPENARRKFKGGMGNKWRQMLN
jgi:hypothetical protein